MLKNISNLGVALSRSQQQRITGGQVILPGERNTDKEEVITTVEVLDRCDIALIWEECGN